jgi:pectinesterase
MSKNKKILVLLIMVFITSSNLAFTQEIYEMTVAIDGTGDYTSIQKAIDACKSFPDKRITIHVKNGVYKEKVVVPACNNKLSIIGESTDKTIISYGDFFNKINRGRNSTFFTYTLLVEADDFYAENLTIENSAGPVGQGVALHVAGDRCVFRNCRIVGNQDTLYTDGLNSRQYFVNCYIEGTTDFIFGAATVLFENCTVCSKANSYITAASTTEGKKFGYVFLNCRITANEGVTKVYLGRPWRDFAKVVFIKCDLGASILPQGWSNWSGTNRDKTAFFGEFENRGAGSDISQRVVWSHQLTKEEAAEFTLEKILSPYIISESPAEQWIKGKD